MKPAWRKAIAATEVVGGVCGSATVAYHLARSRPAPADLAPMAVLIAVHLLALYAGVMLWRDTRQGRVASVVAQLIQLPKVLSPELAFWVSYGLDFAPMRMDSPGPAGWGLVLGGRFPSEQLLLVNASVQPGGFGLSVVSLVALWLLLRPAATRVPEPNPDGQPEWVPPFWLRAAGVLIVVTVCCPCLCLLPSVRWSGPAQHLGPSGDPASAPLR